jgi:hypothetical protein
MQVLGQREMAKLGFGARAGKREAASSGSRGEELQQRRE